MVNLMEESERPYLVLVGRRVRAARILAGLAQWELAAGAEASRVTLGSIERGDHAAGVLTYLKLSRALGVPMGSLLNEKSA